MRDKNMKNIIITYCDMCSQRIEEDVYEITKMPLKVRGAKEGTKGLICQKCYKEIERIIQNR